MAYEIEKEHVQQYKEEKNTRWTMAEQGEEEAIKKICSIFAKTFSITEEKITYDRYDLLWFKKYNIEAEENEWIKGASDYVVSINFDSNLYLLVEIKLKSQEYRKTITGGETKNGSKIEKYGCTSYYLDIVPVLRNMNNFVEKANINPRAFLVAFVKDDFKEINIISLANINYIINNGWKKNNENTIKICIFGEGYGQNTYLIPKNATKNIHYITKEDLLKILLSENPNPSNTTNILAK